MSAFKYKNRCSVELNKFSRTVHSSSVPFKFCAGLSVKDRLLLGSSHTLQVAKGLSASIKLYPHT